METNCDAERNTCVKMPAFKISMLDKVRSVHEFATLVTNHPPRREYIDETCLEQAQGARWLAASLMTREKEECVHYPPQDPTAHEKIPQSRPPNVF